ncbi:prenyltransferase/squalene oxidase repeat-containing protein [Frankia sp. ACN1ag]|uniref:terpene cyclase/mutase family protein n=1 Tax=Frankia sp. ACN1ag TaxID=102891 RepID=UPI0006DCE470|nr:terpene cyclase/mutase family protein [Frankia sp. ACN1ag]KQC35142.1 squalene-hopene cyclase [Frankia sp. ACN1ag]
MSLTSDPSPAAPTAEKSPKRPTIPVPATADAYGISRSSPPLPAGTGRPHTAGPINAGVAAARARDHLLALQSDEGWWKGDLETNVTMDAEDLFMKQFLGIRGDDETEQTARWIRSQQLADGGWPTFYGGPADLSTTIEAYIALRLAGDAVDAPHMARAAELVRAQGGVAASRVFTRIWLAALGQWSWDDVPVIPPELIFLPSWIPLNVYDFACWARQTIVALTIVGSLRPSHDLGFTIDELKVPAAGRKPAPLRSWEGAFERLDKLLHRYERRPIKLLRTLALRRATEWVVARQEADGCWGGIQPPWVYSVMALHLMGYPLNHPVIATAFRGMERYVIRRDTPEGPIRQIEACQSPVWDTALAVVALADAGVPGDHPAMVKAGRWLVDEEVRVAGDWAVRRPELAPGGWAFEFDNDFYPDVDDTAEVVLALRRLLGAGHVAPPASRQGRAEAPAVNTVEDADPRLAAAMRAAAARGVDWSVGMRSSNGAWGAFDADNVRTLTTKIPFCDFGEVVDPPSADVTAHIVEMLADLGRSDHPITQRAVQWLLDNQEPGGSWFGRWGVNHLYGTGAVVPALIGAGVPTDHPAITAAVRWLLEHQSPEGGWGEDLRSYTDPAWIGRGELTASQTAWALLALLAVDPHSLAVKRGVRWLCETQRPDGTWDEPYFTGTGFPGDFSLNYHLYRLVFPLTALGRYVGLTGVATP